MVYSVSRRQFVQPTLRAKGLAKKIDKASQEATIVGCSACIDEEKSTPMEVLGQQLDLLSRQPNPRLAERDVLASGEEKVNRITKQFLRQENVRCSGSNLRMDSGVVAHVARQISQNGSP
jgi:hypothetical protein